MRIGQRAAAVALLAMRTILPVWSADSALEQAAEQIAENGWMFGVVVEQGQMSAVVGHGDTVVLDREPFSVWVVFGGTDAVMLQASTTPTVYNAIGPGFALNDALGGDAEMVMGMGEVEFNLERAIYLDPFAAHYLPNPYGSPSHRFNRVYYGPEGAQFVAGGRDTEWFLDLSDPRDAGFVRVEDAGYKVLYVTAFVAEYDADYRQYVKDFLAFRLTFSNTGR